MRKAGDVCFSQVFRDGGGKICSDLRMIVSFGSWNFALLANGKLKRFSV